MASPFPSWTWSYSGSLGKLCQQAARVASFHRGRQPQPRQGSDLSNKSTVPPYWAQQHGAGPVTVNGSVDRPATIRQMQGDTSDPRSKTSEEVGSSRGEGWAQAYMQQSSGRAQDGAWRQRLDLCAEDASWAGRSGAAGALGDPSASRPHRPVFPLSVITTLSYYFCQQQQATHLCFMHMNPAENMNERSRREEHGWVVPDRKHCLSPAHRSILCRNTSRKKDSMQTSSLGTYTEEPDF